MITNERQYKIAKSELSKINEAITGFDVDKEAAVSGAHIFAQAQLDALQSERDILVENIREYENLRLGAFDILEAKSLKELPMLLVKARIAKGLSQKDLAEKLGLKEQQIQRYEAEQYSSASLRRLIEVSDVLGLRISETARLEAVGIQSPGPQISLDWSRFPVREMYKRAWFDGFNGTLKQAETYSQTLIQKLFSVAGSEPLQSLYHQHIRSGAVLDQYGLLAWQCRIIQLAAKESVLPKFDKAQLTTAWFCALARLSVLVDGPRRAQTFLKDSGIALVFEPHLPQTYLDGAAILAFGDIPVIGMTLRYDRMDNFWFVLFHELAHLVLHLHKGKTERFFDDLDVKGDETEQEADKFAGNRLIPNDIWEVSPARYLRSEKTIKELAAELEISPAIIAGRIRKEADNYIILRNLVGAGEVRKQFPELTYA